VRPGGRYVLMGLTGQPVTVPFDLIAFHELIVTAGFASTKSSWDLAIDLIERRAVELEPLLSEVVPLERWAEAFAATRAGEGIKYVLDPN
jgi:L-iditol 2-dehydrogenase